MTTRHSLFAALACCVCCVAAVTACAVEGPYNPDNLAADQLGRVSGICQTVMGLSPSEPLDGGYWMNNDRLDYYTSHYRGCIVSLSDSLQNVMDEQMTQEADADCRAKGLQPGNPDLALCVLNSVNNPPRPAARQATTALSATPVSLNLPAASGSFIYASPGETARREQVACAALGFSPSHSAFKGCVKGLSETLYAIDHPIT
jgi:hypothetical protein